MAYEFKSAKDDQEDDKTGPTAPDFVPPVLAGGSGSETAVQQQSPSAPSSFVNFDRIIAANKDIAERNANQLTGTLKTNAQGANAALTGVVTTFNNAVAAGTPKKPVPAAAGPKPNPLMTLGMAPKPDAGN